MSFMRGTLIQRMDAKIAKSDGCWNWTGATGWYGYGQIYVGRDATRRIDAAHRVTWRLAHGDIPPGLHVCHVCDNPSWVASDRVDCVPQTDVVGAKNVSLLIANHNQPAIRFDVETRNIDA